MTAGVRVLGSLEAEAGGTQVDLGGRRQRAVLALQPVAQALGELSVLLGRPGQAAGYFSQADELARRWNSAHWTERARTAWAGL